MVRNDSSICLFIGQDCPAKDAALDTIKKDLLSRRTAEFNLDVVFGKEASLKELQEKLLFLPVQSSKRLVVVKDAQALKQEAKEFVLAYSRKPSGQVALVLDFRSSEGQDVFIRQVAGARVVRFQEEKPQTVFDLSRQIEAGKVAASLTILNSLLKKGEKPELILGGLRVRLERRFNDLRQLKKISRLLLECDQGIKTGVMRPSFALEKLIVSLCSFKNFPG